MSKKLMCSTCTNVREVSELKLFTNSEETVRMCNECVVEYNMDKVYINGVHPEVLALSKPCAVCHAPLTADEKGACRSCVMELQGV